MVHEKWSNVLFLHWIVPKHLEDILKCHTSPFLLDRFDDGNAYIGLILLTEENVGPSIGRFKWTCVTHHGINVRTYVQGVDRGEDRENNNDDDDDDNDNNKENNDNDTKNRKQQRGIHFSSLECDDEFTSYGANYFGMPYQVAKMTRRNSHSSEDTTVRTNDDNDNKNNNNNINNNNNNNKLQPIIDSHSGGVSAYQSNNKYCYYRVRSERLQSATPSFFRMIVRNLFHYWSPLLRLFHFTTINKKIQLRQNNDEQIMNNTNQLPLSLSVPAIARVDDSEQVPPKFTVDCTWNICETSCEDNTLQVVQEEEAIEEGTQRIKNENDTIDLDANDNFSNWVMERYFVYTRKYFVDWCGGIEHEQWPVVRSKNIELEHLQITNIDTYEPKIMRPILSYMSENAPDSILFSPGVGPVQFNMLQPI